MMMAGKNARVLRNATSWLFLAPALAVNTMFFVGPMLFTLWTSFYEWDGLSDNMTFVGLRNHIEILFNDDVSQLALKNNLLWTAGGISILPVLAVFIFLKKYFVSGLTGGVKG